LKTLSPRKGRLLVTGASGLLGNKIVVLAKDYYLVTATDVTEPLYSNFVKTDIVNPNEVSCLFGKHKPDIVIHTASETNVDKCETQREHAWKINVEGTRNIAEACKQTNAKLICISTDYVFDGEKGWYSEEDCPNPINYYGLTKLEGEKQVMRNCKNYAVLRTSVLYGRHPWKQDFAAWIINKLKQNQEITVVDDHYNTPTLAENLANMALEVGTRDMQGIFHTSGNERINRYEFAKQIAKTFDLDSALVKPIKMNELKAWIAKRPKDSSLSTAKIQNQLKTKPLNINEGLQRLKVDMET